MYRLGYSVGANTHVYKRPILFKLDTDKSKAVNLTERRRIQSVNSI